MPLLPLPTDPHTTIQEHDFINANYDNQQPFHGKLRTLYILLSTPRSGSTLLSSALCDQTGIVMHEYLQPFQYLPALAERYQAINVSKQNANPKSDRIISLGDYFIKLIQHRAIDGVLAINCHVAHKPYLEALVRLARTKYPELEIIQDYLFRRDKCSQAASCAIAQHTRSWSSIRRPAGSMTSTREVLCLSINAARYHHKLVVEDRQVQASHVILECQKILCFEDDILQNLDQTAAEIAARLNLRRASHQDQKIAAPKLQKQSTELNQAIAGLLGRYGPV